MSELTSIADALPPDHEARMRALDTHQSFLVQAPAGSGKTHLLTQRFLRLLSQAEKPDEIVAITFTKAAAAEMQQRILAQLEQAERTKTGLNTADRDHDPLSLQSLAAAALARSEQLGWQLLDQPAQLRITTIDAFCRGLALQCPLSWGPLSGLGGSLDVVDNPSELYRSAARRTIESLLESSLPTRAAIEALLLLRDNSWKDVEDQIVKMLADRNRWYRDFVFKQTVRDRDWIELRHRLEAPFRRAAHAKLEAAHALFDQLEGSHDLALELAQYACETEGKASPVRLADRAAFPRPPFADDLRDAVDAYHGLACFLLTRDKGWRKSVTVTEGFPTGAQGKLRKQQFFSFVDSLKKAPGIHAALAAFLFPTPTAYTEDEWQLVRHCFAVLREAAGQLQVVFAESGAADYTEIAQIALRVLADADETPSDFALQLGEGIRHLLVDEFQDTSRNQHQLLSRILSAWPDRQGRSCFCVGDPMQSIYGFREAEVELFENLKSDGLTIRSADMSEDRFRFEFLSLTANFRTEPSLVNDLNDRFEKIFDVDDGSGVTFSRSQPARMHHREATTQLHLAFTLNQRGASKRNAAASAGPDAGDPGSTRAAQLEEMVALVREHLEKANAIRLRSATHSAKYRIAVLGRTRKSLLIVAEALELAGIGFRAIDLVPLRERPEVLDALTLARALLNPIDRTAWLGVLRAPWCGLTLAELHLLTSADDPDILAAPIPRLLDTRLETLADAGKLEERTLATLRRVWAVLKTALEDRHAHAGNTLGTWLDSVWRGLGGEDTVDAQQRENLQLLWTFLDARPQGELDLFSPLLNDSLDRLFAQPDPEASSDFGVQLMTIHKSKGLEFEVVFVPDLEAFTKKNDPSMFSWLERGLPSVDENGQSTEFLIAPIQSKGESAGEARRWVDAVKNLRDTQEIRRQFYVAATRAREELHLWARPTFTVGNGKQYKLDKPAVSLLSTAWPALSAEIDLRFNQWVATQIADHAPSDVIGDLAASAVKNLLQMPTLSGRPSKPTRLHRLPANYQAPVMVHAGSEWPGGVSATADDSSAVLYKRSEGGLHSRLEGIAIHTLLEQLSRMRERAGEVMDSHLIIKTLAESMPALVSNIRSHGLPLQAAQTLAKRALEVAERIVMHAQSEWIFRPHLEAASESRWTGVIRDQQWNLRPDRVFFAPPPASPGTVAISADPAWWIIDYKSSHASEAELNGVDSRARFLANHREQHGPQLAVYAQVLRNLKAAGSEARIRVHAGIYYPRLLLFDWWEV